MIALFRNIAEMEIWRCSCSRLTVEIVDWQAILDCLPVAMAQSTTCRTASVLFRPISDQGSIRSRVRRIGRLPDHSDSICRITARRAFWIWCRTALRLTLLGIEAMVLRARSTGTAGQRLGGATVRKPGEGAARRQMTLTGTSQSGQACRRTLRPNFTPACLT